MDDLGWIGKTMILVGLLLAGIGGLILLLQRVPGIRLFRLPGDIHIERDGLTIYIPIVTMLLISVVATILFWIFGWLRK